WKVSGLSYGVGCAHIGVLHKKSSRSTWGSSSLCTTSASEAKRCFLRSLSFSSHKTPESNKSVAQKMSEVLFPVLLVFSAYHACEKICDRLCVSVRSRLRHRRAVTTVQVKALLLTGSEVFVVALLAERKHVMPETVQDATPPFITVGYTAKVVFTQ